jgi:hypothetical protein
MPQDWWRGALAGDDGRNLWYLAQPETKLRQKTMASSVDELTINYTEDGIDVVKELDKVVLSKGAWCTLMFRYQDWNRAKGEYGPDKYSIRRYQKRNGEYQSKSKFNISSKAQAQGIIEALQRWIED